MNGLAKKLVAAALWTALGACPPLGGGVSAAAEPGAAAPGSAQIPDRPMGLSAVAIEPGRVELTWNRPEVAGLSGFRILRGVGRDAEPFPVAVIPAAATGRQRFVDRIPEATGYVFSYQILGLGGKEEPLAASERVLVEPPDTRPPARPVITDFDAGRGTIRIAWSPAADGAIAGFNVYRASDEDDAERQLNPAPVAEVFYEDRDISGGRLYHYSVTAVDRSGTESARSNRRSVRGTGTPSNAPPTGLAVAADPGGMPTLTWRAAPAGELRGYLVYRRDGAGGDYLNISGLITEARFADGSPGTGPRWYRVRTVLRGGLLSEASDAVVWSTGDEKNEPR